MIATDKGIEELQDRAVKEFVKELKKHTHNYYPSIDSYCVSRHVVLVDDIDKALKEYLGKRVREL